MKHLVIALILSASAAGFSAQQSGIATGQPHVDNTQFNAEPASTGLSATVTRFRQSGQQVWIGYSVSALPSGHTSSCSNLGSASSPDDGCCGEYHLEDTHHGVSNAAANNADLRTIYVLIRLEQGAVYKVLAVNAGCRLDAGGVPFHWLTGVQPEDSVSFLSSLAASSTENRVTDGALAALAMHATPAATQALASLAGPSNPAHIREKAAFWLGAGRGHEGLLALRELVKNEQDPKLREKLTFDLFVNSDPAAVDELLALAKSDANPGVRSQALFWLAQKAGKKATATLAASAENDPDVQVKKKAVFALSQLPTEEGVPQLIHVADTNSNPAIRRDALFWLGQSKDPRALTYIESILKR
jgi:hypothetical protein